MTPKGRALLWKEWREWRLPFALCMAWAVGLIAAQIVYEFIMTNTVVDRNATPDNRNSSPQFRHRRMSVRQSFGGWMRKDGADMSETWSQRAGAKGLGDCASHAAHLDMNIQATRNGLPSLAKTLARTLRMKNVRGATAICHKIIVH